MLRGVKGTAGDDNPRCACEKCKGEVYEGELMVNLDGRMVCVDCFQMEIESWVNRDPEGFAKTFLYETERV